MRSLLFVSGWGFTPRVFKPLAEAFGDDYSCHFEDGNALTSPGSLNDRIDQLDTPPVIVGWSMGGMLAIEAALVAPEKVVALVLLSATLKFCADDEYLWGVPEQQVRAMKLGLRRRPDRILSDFKASVCRPQPTDLLSDDLLHTDPATLATGLDYLNNTDLRACAFDGLPPSLVYHGKRDAIISCNAGRAISKQLHSNHLMRYNGIGHALPVVQPAILAANITFHLDKLDG